LRQFIILAAAWVALVGCAPVSPSSPPPIAGGGLHRERPTFYQAKDSLYEGVVATVFSTEDGFVGGCFTMVSLEDGRPEEAVYAQCASDPRGAPPMVVHLVATESIAARLKADGLESASRVTITRTEGPLPRQDANELRAAWVRLLGNARVEVGATLREQRRDYYFSAFRPGLFQGIVSGVARNPTPDSKAARFVNLARRLAAVADATEANRMPAIESLRQSLKNL
jgi:hypothetical protein